VARDPGQRVGGETLVGTTASETLAGAWADQLHVGAGRSRGLAGGCAPAVSVV